MNDQDLAAQVWEDSIRAWKAVLENKRFIDPDLTKQADKAIIQTIAAYGQERYRAGVEAMRDAVYEMICQDIDRDLFDGHYVEVVLNEESARLLAE